MKTKIFNKKTAIAMISFGLLALPVAFPLIAKADTTNTTVSVAVGTVISAFTTSTTVTLGALTPDATGTQSINKDTVSVTTNDSAGITLSLKDADTTYTLASGGNSFAATGGTPASPTTLANNTWGWRVDSLSGFGAGPTSVTSNAAPSALTFAAIPVNATPFTIKTTSTTGTSSTDVWYSARASNTQPSGTYSDTVTYTATLN